MWPSEETASRLYSLANGGLIVGLVIGLISTVLIAWMGNIKEDYLKRALADSKEHTAEANGAAQAQQRAAEAQLALEKFKAPRVLDSREQQLVISRLRKFVGQEYWIQTLWAADEPQYFANQLKRTLEAAGWSSNSNRKVDVLTGGVSGVQVWVNPNADPEVKEAANELVAVLDELNKKPILKLQGRNAERNNRIGINIGTKH